jgi:hypothetical protein
VLLSSFLETRLQSYESKGVSASDEGLQRADQEPLREWRAWSEGRPVLAK